MQAMQANIKQACRAGGHAGQAGMQGRLCMASKQENAQGVRAMLYRVFGCVDV
jgi:hypothetical protein